MSHDVHGFSPLNPACVFRRLTPDKTPVRQPPLALGRPVHYAEHMDDTEWMLLLIAAGACLAEWGRRWYRRRVAARLADKLLRDVVKGKDAFRR